MAKFVVDVSGTLIVPNEIAQCGKASGTASCWSAATAAHAQNPWLPADIDTVVAALCQTCAAQIGD